MPENGNYGNVYCSLTVLRSSSWAGVVTRSHAPRLFEKGTYLLMATHLVTMSSSRCDALYPRKGFGWIRDGAARAGRYRSLYHCPNALRPTTKQVWREERESIYDVSDGECCSPKRFGNIAAQVVEVWRWSAQSGLATDTKRERHSSLSRAPPICHEWKMFSSRQAYMAGSGGNRRLRPISCDQWYLSYNPNPNSEIE